MKNLKVSDIPRKDYVYYIVIETKKKKILNLLPLFFFFFLILLRCSPSIIILNMIWMNIFLVSGVYF